MTTVREAILDLFRTHNLTTWFGNPGSSELALLQDFPDDLRYFLGLQEMIPVGMADAYAQVTRRPAVVNLHTAPGMGNAQGLSQQMFTSLTTQSNTGPIGTMSAQGTQLYGGMTMTAGIPRVRAPKATPWA